MAERLQAGTTSQAHEAFTQTVEKERDALIKRSRLNYIHWLVIALSIVLTIAAWQYSEYLIGLRMQNRFEVAAGQIPELMRKRLQKYELALLAGVSVLKANGGEFDW